MKISKYKNKLNYHGFTLVEMLIYIALMAIVISGFVAFALSISDSRNKNYVVQEVQANSRVALNLITQKILAADGVNVSASTFDSDPGVLSLSMADSNKNPTVISLTADDGQLQIKEGSSSEVMVVSNEVKITNLVFTNLSSTSSRSNIRIEMTVEYNNQGTDIDYDYSQSLETSVSLRQ